MLEYPNLVTSPRATSRLFLSVVLVVSKSKYVWGKNIDAPQQTGESA